jgi:hypothetical protein
MGMLDKVGSANGPSGGGNYYTPGTYIVRLEAAINKQSAQGKGELVAVETTVLEIETAFQGSKQSGERCSTVYMEKTGQVVIDNLRGFVGAVIGEDPNAKTHPPEKWSKWAGEVCGGDGQAFKGTLLRVIAQDITLRNGKPFTKVSWYALSVEDEAKYTAKYATTAKK